MPRGPRILLNNVYYHIVNRGNQNGKIFFEESDFEKYLELLRRYKNKFPLKLFGYCLMPNHIHLILQLKESKDLSKLMQGLTQTYTVWFNNKYGRFGRIWQGRFKSMIIQMDNYFLECIYYVEMNPVRKGLVLSPIEYTWSSYRDRTLGNENDLIDFADST